MKIDQIILYNFGSYEGETQFDTKDHNGKNIVLFGGKNGAGKTTLFTAMRLCLYGYMSMGYKNQNAFYNRAVTKLVNNTAKMVRPAESYVQMTIQISNGRGVDEYILTRQWILNESLSESFSVIKNEISLTPDEVADFEKYLLSVIPPELFNLYFFDGEKIADFFLEEGSNTRIKNAFLTLCGYDTFDIMRRNFKRVSAGRPQSTTVLDEYLTAKESVTEEQNKRDTLQAQLNQCLDDIASCAGELDSVEKEYRQKGGISQEEWDEKLLAIKEEEKKREQWNALLKKWANELVPFLMIRDQLVSLQAQINKENADLKYRNFVEVLDTPDILKLIGKKDAKVKELAYRLFGSEEQSILDLSIDQSAILLAQIKRLLDFDVEKVARCKRAIKKSIQTTTKLRQELDNSSVNSVQEYMKKRAQLFETKSLLLLQQVELERKLVEQEECVSQAEAHLAKVQSRLEEELKRESITDISAKAIIMLDKLQQVLYRKQIEKVEAFFRAEIKTLMRKTHFIDDIHIDDDFGTHLYRKESMPVAKLINMLSSSSEVQVTTNLGTAAVEALKRHAKTNNYYDIVDALLAWKNKTITLPIEIDKTSLSNGEKQIFIMALYHSLVQLCDHEIPFIIDTPFARIDTEHRRNISKHFFSCLNGQVFILSTNEEINSAHVQIMKDRIAATYLLENTDNKRTVVVKNKYFEE